MSEDKRPTLVQLHRELAGEAGGQPLEVFRVDQQVREFVTITAECEEVCVHYLADPDVNSYVHCNANGKKADCVLCRVENRAETRYLVPVYDPRTEAVAVLAGSPSCRPNALLPQLWRRLQAHGRTVPAVLPPQRSAAPAVRGAGEGPPPGHLHQARAGEIHPPGHGPGGGDGRRAAASAAFGHQYEAGTVRLADVFVRLSNEHLARLTSVARSLKYRGAKP
jgi:hypothetical protein